MSKADMMFEKLGYEKYNEFVYIKIKDKGIVIEFDQEEKTFRKDFYGEIGEITMQELQAINKKVKELGWNE